MNLRYLRAWTNGSTVNDGNYWYEIEIYNTSGTKISTGKSVTTNGSVTTESAGTVNAVTDNNLSTYCALGNKGDTYVQIDLGSVQDCGKVVFLPYWNDGRRYYNFKVEVSSDGTNWDTIIQTNLTATIYSYGMIFDLNNLTGLSYNGTVISRRSDRSDYPYFNDTKVNNVYNKSTGAIVWQKYSNIYFKFDGGTVTGYDGPGGDITIPSYYSIMTEPDGTVYFKGESSSGTGRTQVTAIAEGAFRGNTTITGVSGPTTITSIPNNAFRDCTSLTKTTLYGVTSIGAYAFYNSKFSTWSTYNENLTSIGEYAFYGCPLTSSSVKYLLRCTYPQESVAIGTMALAGGTWWFDWISALDIESATITNLMNSATNDSLLHYFKTVTFTPSKSSGSESASGGWNFKYKAVGKTSGTTYKDTSASCNVSGSRSQNAGILYRNLDSSGLTVSCYNVSSGEGPVGNTGTSVSGAVTVSGKNSTASFTLYYTTACLTDHTLLTLANRSRKRADQITYKDLLLCYNFETGKQDYQYPLSITKGDTHNHFTRVHLENNLYIDICGHHDIYDPKAHMFRTYGDCNIMSVGLKDYYILDDSGQTVKIKLIERIEKEVTAYCIVTSGTTTAYADTAMVGMQHMNYSRIGEENKFIKAFETDKLLCYDYNTFKQEIYDEPEQDLIIGLNLHYAHYYNKDASGLPRLLAPLKRRIPLPQYKNKNLYTLGFIDKELKEIESVQDEIIVLPEIKSPGKTKWYIVGEYKYLNPGDTYITKFSTVIRAV